MTKITESYRTAAMDLFGLSREEAVECIKTPQEDTGEWAPNSLAVIYLEYGHLPVSYWHGDMFERLNELSDKAGVGYVECINAAVCAVYE